MKTISKKPFNLFVIFLLTFIQSCTSTGPVEKVSSRLIDRPYTLPEGVAAWKTATTTIVEKLNNKSKLDFFNFPIPLPIFWEQALNNDLTLEWSPAPAALRYQFLKTDSQIWGGKIGIGILTGLDQLLIIPRFSIFNRTNISHNIAIEANFILGFSYKNTKGYKTGISTYLDLGPVFQVSNNFAIKPALGIRPGLEPDMSKQISLIEYTSSNRKLLFPCKLNFDWKFTNQWLLETQYEYLKMYSKEYALHTLNLNLIHYW